MKRREFIKLAGTTSFALTTSSGLINYSSVNLLKRKRPNVLVLLTDQQHFDTLSYAGNKFINTPNMDYLMQRGLSFTNSYTTNPVCSPARSSIFTSRMPSETGVFQNNKHLRTGMPTMGSWFAEQGGYDSVYAGKWHIPATYTHFIPGFRVINTGIMGQGNVCDTLVSRACSSYIRNRTATNPFLMVASFMQPHDICEWLRLNTYPSEDAKFYDFAGELPPLPDNFKCNFQEPADIINTQSKYAPKLGEWSELHWRYYIWSYYRHVEQVDAEIGRIIQSLKDTGRLDETIIIFTSDHGEGLGSHQSVRKNSPYDESARVPFILSYIGTIPVDTVDSENLVSGLDILPTICDLTGVEAPADMRGRSVRNTLATNQEHQTNPYVVSEVNKDQCRMLRSKEYKYVTHHNEEIDLLFNMKTDPGETVNLANNPDFASILAEHKKMLLEWESGSDVAPGLPNADAWWRRV